MFIRCVVGFLFYIDGYIMVMLWFALRGEHIRDCFEQMVGIIWCTRLMWDGESVAGCLYFDAMFIFYWEI